MLSNSTLKVVRGKNYSKFGIILDVNNEVVVEIWITKRCVADYTNASVWFRILCIAGFGGMRQYVGWLICMYKVTSKIRFDVLLRGGVGLWKTSQWRFPFKNWFNSFRFNQTKKVIWVNFFVTYVACNWYFLIFQWFPTISQYVTSDWCKIFFKTVKGFKLK